jgi:hypothetical protein
MSDVKSNKDATIAVAYMVRQGLEGFDQAAGAAQQQERPVTISEIARYVMGADVPAVEAKLREDLSIRRTYQQLLAKRRHMYMPMAKAAATASLILERDSDHFTIKLVPAKNHAGQYYVTLQLKSSAEISADAELVMHVILDDRAARCNFPALQSGRCQVVVSESDLLFQLLTTADSEIFVY